jgi:competence protein ComEA
VPSWLKNLELDEDSQETAIAWLENMPESLRSDDDEQHRNDLSANQIAETDDVSDELGWMEDLHSQEEEKSIGAVESTAELSEDLIASELIPEQQEEDKLFDLEEIESIESDIPSWLDELGDEGESIPSVATSPEAPEEIIQDEPVTSAEIFSKELGEKIPQQPAESEQIDSLMPDWLSEIDSEDDTPAAESPPAAPELTPAAEEEQPDIPDWLGEFQEEQAAQDTDGETDSLAWLESLAEKQGVPDEELFTSPEDRAQALAPEAPSTPIPESEPTVEVSPSDETLNTVFPDWLSKLDDQEIVKEPEASTEDIVAESEFEDSTSWLDQIDEKSITETDEGSTAEEDSDVLEWLEGIEGQGEPLPTDEDIRESLAGDLVDETPPVEEETAETIPGEESQAESMPDWLAELETDDQDEVSSLQSAIRQSDHPLTEEEKEFLERVEEEQDENADWLAKLDLVDDPSPAEPDTPAIKVDIPEEKQQEKLVEEPEAISVSGGILDRLKDPDEEISETEVPQWLENLKKEEDPQETAILWLKQFVEQGDKANLKAEIKRYTDELDPGDTVPEWMEDLKNEEDPQTTAMLWLEKLSGKREEAAVKPKSPQEVQDESGWLADLEKEAAEQAKEPVEDQSKDFKDSTEGWLDDLEIDEKLKTSIDEEIPDWAQTEESSESEEGDEQDGETPLWMKATSPLEGEFYTDELAGNGEKEVVIPDWLAGYSEGEEPEEKTEPEAGVPESEPVPPGATSDQDEYAWVSATDDPVKPSGEPIDLNKAAISQLESILGISFQVAKGIVTYREKHGPYKTLEDLLNVPDIKDEQTIEILKPEVIIREIKEKPKPVEKTSPVIEEAPEMRLTKARSLLSDSKIEEALEHYEYLIIKKKSIPDVIKDLIQASFDHPLDVPLMKTLGDAYMRVDKLDEALDAYSKAEDLLQ